MAFDRSRNSMNLIRLLLASFVVASHCLPISGRGVGLYFGHGELSMFAVDAFFVISGFLITGSRLNLSTGRFLWHRVLRILPAYWACLVITAFIAAPIAWLRYHSSLAGFFTAGHNPFLYLLRNCALVVNLWDVSGTPAHVPVPAKWDGSLWTLDWEFACYLTVALLGALGLLVRPRADRRGQDPSPGSRATAGPTGSGTPTGPDVPRNRQAGGRFADRPGLLVGLVVVLWVVLAFHAFVPSVAHVVFVHLDAPTRFSLLFSSGMLLNLYQDWVPFSDLLAAGAVAWLLVVYRFDAHPYVLIGPPLAYVCLWASVRLPMPAFLRHHDLSYGLYIYAMPAQQLLVLYGAARWNLAGYYAASFAAGLALATFSWLFIERRALRLKDYRLAHGHTSAALATVPAARTESVPGASAAPEPCRALPAEPSTAPEPAPHRSDHRGAWPRGTARGASVLGGPRLSRRRPVGPGRTPTEPEAARRSWADPD
jgi:peptidoglycan/LPS O-acetylase OafA/YrhL